MSEKDVIKDVEVEKEVKVEPFKYGVSPSLIITMARDKKIYRFEMPIGAQLDECEEACNECLKIVTVMKKEGEAKMAEEKAKKKAEPPSEDLKKEDK